MHLAIDLDALHHLATIGLDATVHIMQADAGNPTRGSVVKLRREVFREGVVFAVLFPTRYHIVSLVHNHPVHLRQFLRSILQVSVQGAHHPSFRLFETAEKRCALAVIPAERDSLYAGVFARKVTNALPRAILAAIIYQNQFITKAFAAHRRIDSANQFGQRFVFVEQRNDDADVFLVFHDATVDRDYRIGGNWRRDLGRVSFWRGCGTGLRPIGYNKTRYPRT